MTTEDRGDRFVAEVRARLDASMAEAGLPLDGVYANDAPDLGEGRDPSVLYEGVVSDYLARFPGLDPWWDEEWRRVPDGCVDLWIQYHERDDRIAVRLEQWKIGDLTRRYGDETTQLELESALAGGEDMARRVDVIASLLERALTVAATEKRPG